MKWMLLVVVMLAVVWFVRSPGMGQTGGADGELQDLVRNQGAALLDVRSPQEFRAGHMAGAANVPVDRLSDVRGVLPDTNRPVVVYCRSGARSSRAVTVLRQMGYTQVFDLGPMRGW